MAILITLKEPRANSWHIVTYDISDPDSWIEIDDIQTSQAISVDLDVVRVKRTATERRPDQVPVISGQERFEERFLEASQNFAAELPFSVSSNDVLVSFEHGQMKWTLHKDRGQLVSYDFSVIKDGISFQHGSATMVLGDQGLSVGCTLHQGSSMLTVSTKFPREPQTQEYKIKTDIKLEGETYEFHLKPYGNQEMVEFPEKLTELLRQFDSSYLEEIELQIPDFKYLTKLLFTAGPENLLPNYFKGGGPWTGPEIIALIIALAGLSVSCGAGAWPACWSVIAVAVAVKHCGESRRAELIPDP